MGVQAGKDVSMTVAGSSVAGLRDVTFNRSRLELDTSAVGDDAMERASGLKDATLSFSGVANTTDSAFIALMDAVKDGTTISNVIFNHGTDGASNDEIALASAFVMSMEITSAVDGIVEFNAELGGNDTNNGWTKQ